MTSRSVALCPPVVVDEGGSGGANGALVGIMRYSNILEGGVDSQSVTINLATCNSLYY